MPTLPGIESARPTPQARTSITRAPRPMVAEATANLGRDITRAGADVYDAFEQERQRINKLRVEAAFNEVRAKQMELSAGENGFTRLRAGDAVKQPVLKNYTEQWDQAIGSIADNLDNDEQREALRLRADAAKTQYQGDILGHVQREEGVYQGQVLTATAATEAQAAGMRWNTPADAQAALVRVRAAVNTYADTNGLTDPVVRNAAYVEQAAKVHRAVIENAVNANNPDYARLWLEQNRGEIDAATADDLHDLIKASGNRVVTQRGAAEIWSLNLPEDKAKAEARKRFTGEQQDEVVTRLSALYAERDQVKQDGYRAAWDEVSKYLAKGSKRDAIPDSLWFRMSGDDQMKAKNLLAAKAKPDADNSLRAYFALLDAARTDPQGFAKEPLDAYIGLIDETRLIELKKLQGNPPEQAVSRTKEQIIKQGAAAAGFDPKKLTEDNAAGQRVRGFYDRVDRELAAFQQMNGRQPTTKDMQDIVDRLSIDVVKDPEAFYFTGTRAAINTEIQGVPADMVDDLAMAVRNAGQPVTDANIRALYEYLRGGQ